MSENYYPIEIDVAKGSFTITNGGTAPAPCKITIIPKVDIMKLTITGLSKNPIEVSRVKTNDVLVIDGETHQVLINDEDAFGSYNAWEFPKVQPGVNEVSITNANQITIQIEYDTRYI